LGFAALVAVPAGFSYLQLQLSKNQPGGVGASVAQRMGARKVSEKEYPGLYRSVRVRTAFYLDVPFHRVVELFLRLKKNKDGQGLRRRKTNLWWSVRVRMDINRFPKGFLNSHNSS
jgi:hypothetical protein